MDRDHNYNLKIKWTGNTGQGTSGYRSYERSYTVAAENKPEILCSSDTSFRGDKTRYNPEELFISAISGCHMLWFLHLCADSNIIVVDYFDKAEGTMAESSDGSGHFTKVTLSPQVVITNKEMLDKVNELHQKANKLCFISNSCNFPILHNPTCIIQNA